MPDPSQLPLALPHQPSYGRDDFMLGQSNRAAFRLMESWPSWPASTVLLTGPPGSGKTHLAHIWAGRADAEIIPASLLMAQHIDRTIGPSAALAVEDVPPYEVPEAALFHLINGIGEARGSLLLTSRARPEEWQLRLSDLRSRLRLAAPAVLGGPDDDLLRQVLVKLFADRQLVVDKPVIDYLISRMERSLSAATDLVEKLDREALAAGRGITRSMAAEVLAGTEGAKGFADQQ